MPSLTLTLLGSPQIMRADRAAVAFRSRKELALLAYLAVEGSAAKRRDTLLGLLWPDASEEAARNSLRVALANLRLALGDAAPTADRQVVQLALDGDALDVATFRTLLTASRAHRHERNLLCAACAARLGQAVELYRGDFLAGFALPDAEAFEEWALIRREALHQQVLDALSTLAEYHEQVGDYAALCRVARRQLELEPWHEPAQRQLMRGLALTGDRDAALRQYERCRQVLADELGVEPEVATRALYEQIRAGQLTPATREVAAPRHNLPAVLTSFVGREVELDALGALLAQPDMRLLTLVGAGGMGKTRLALELGRASLDAYADGVFFVALAPLADAAALPAAITQAINLTIQGGDPAAALLRFLRDKHMLLILDNFEHLRDGVGLVVDILVAAPQVQIMATSRERLGMRGEYLFVVEGLPYADGTMVSDAAATPAVRLFAQSARRAYPTFQIGELNLPDVLRICRLVQGMPLGIELAAAWVELISLHELAQEIKRSAGFLAADWADAPERQRSMRAVFEWSWHLLNAAEQQLFRRLAVFRGPFTREAAMAVVGASLHVLAGLVHKSLLRRSDAGASQAGRYEMHELLRQFAAEQLATNPNERAAIEGRHCTFYLAFVAQRELRLARQEPQQAAAEIRGEIDNIRAAWAWAATNMRVDDLERSVHGLLQFYWLIGLALEGEEIFRLAAEQIGRQIDTITSAQAMAKCHSLVSRLLAVQALFMNRQSKYDQAIRVAQQAIGTGPVSDDPTGEAIGYVCWGQALFRKGQHSDARPHIERALDLARRALRGGSDHELLREVELEALAWLGMLDKDAGDYQASRAHLLQALQICQHLGKRREECRYLVDIGEIAMIVGDYAAATTSLQAALRLARVYGARAREGTAQLALGIIALIQGSYLAARDLFTDALGILHAIGDRMYEAYTLAFLGRLADCLGDYTRAGDLLDRALRLSQEVGAWESLFFTYVFLALLLHHMGDYATAAHYAEQSLQLAVKAGDRARQAEAWLAVGRAHESVQQLGQAVIAYQQALMLYQQAGRAHLTTEPRAGLARVALLGGEWEVAGAHVEAILISLEHRSLAGLEEPFRVYLTCYRVLRALPDPRAATVLHDAQQRLRTCADQIGDPALRRSFLEDVAAHRELLHCDVSL